ncbi:MAG: DUF1456 family protein [Kiritimatiellaceae bacterium]|nr:DUF1456 family protein [Kiritimatiellaceae bacterium]
MTNNDTLRRLRYALNIDDTKTASIIALTGRETTTTEVTNWLKREDEPNYVALPDETLCRFLDGLIIDRRGPHPSGKAPEPLKFLSNNEVLKKLRIALELKEEGVLNVFKKAEFVVTKAELSSFFRKDGHRNFRKCPEQVLRKFIHGLCTKPEDK